MKPGSRSYTVEASSTGYVGGRYVNKPGLSPKDAASKAATQIFKSEGGRNLKNVRLQIRETTQGSDKKLFAYKAKKVTKRKTVEHDYPVPTKVNYTYDVVLEPVSLFHGDGVQMNKK